MVYYHRVNNSKFCPRFYSQDLLSFNSLSRGWIRKLDPNDDLRNWIINLDIRNFSLDYPWVMTPLSKYHRVILVCMSSL
jgi:hypothetical protein